VTALAREMPWHAYEAMPHSGEPYEEDDDPYEEERSLWVREAYQDAEAWALEGGGLVVR